MTYDLARMAKQSGIRRKTITLRPIEITRTLQEELYVVVVQPVRSWEAQWSETVAPVYARSWDGLVLDAETDDLAEALARAEAGVVAAMVTISGETREWLERALRWHSTRWIAAVRAATGIDVFPFIDMESNRQVLLAFRDRILNLIRDLEGQTRKNVSETVWRGFLNRTPPREVAREIAAVWGVGRRRATRIAIDQANKLSSELTRIRQEEAGFNRYVWRHSGKRHPRPEHVARNGKVFEWSNPPYGGHPGTEPFCGCTAEALLELE